MNGITLDQWLEEFKDKFTTYSTDEISDLAIACGYDRSEVAQWMTKSRFGSAA